MDKKFYYSSENLICPHCKSDEIRYLGESKYSGYIVKCSNCGEIMLESDLEEKEEDEDE